jgi:hypothetical protein
MQEATEEDKTHDTKKHLNGTCPDSMQEAIEDFIKYTESSESSLEGRNVRYQQLLRDIATGSWAFSNEFNKWRSSQI